MESLLYLLLELKRAQLTLAQAQSARSRSSIVRTHYYSVPSVNTVTTTTASPTPVQTQTVQPSTQSTAPVTDFRSQVEAAVLAQTNAQRAQFGLAPLTLDTAVAAVARKHSEDMIANNYFAHTNLQNCDPGCRLTNAGYAWKSYGENIHWMQGYNLTATETANKIVTDWMNSPPHRENILGNFTYAGIGIAISGDKIDSTADYTTR